ncbi:HAMP domain-containing sensor histidine kinase [Flavobacterium sp.]|uniref:sensor histidine kinase n=1 Tax=Flavobacterium sp. TaxID=239 RepID=UPI0026254AE7|nr:HAMP domain-containing sensor histidine kinase [Flavobacterium sp.]MDG2431722.1 HAMP domain-containing sensor histidine kinase [Flavobacterium sp.]
MNNKAITKKFTPHTIFTPLVIVVLSCSFLIFVNYYTIKILSSCRAYVNGESHYSKAQKDGTRNLISYLFTGESKEWKDFNIELLVPQGDRLARIELLTTKRKNVIKDGFRAGRNDEKDINDMIWLFNNFKNISFFKTAISEWGKSDRQIENLTKLGHEINSQMKKKSLSAIEKKSFLNQINNISHEINSSESKFSYSLGEGTRAMKTYLLLINIVLTLIIISSVSVYYNVLFGKLKKSTAETDKKNSKLIIANKELDKFVYSASHDLRAPISSLQGLIEVMKLEQDSDQFNLYLNMMSDSLIKQDQYIRDIIDYSRNKRKQITITNLSLATLINESIAQNKFTKSSCSITITTDLAIDLITNDELRLRIIINNFLSNAIKYSDPEKENPFLHIKTYLNKNGFIIEFSDNGTGIDLAHQDKIFDMFFVTNSSNNGSGLGLYIVKEAVEHLNGSIKVSSKVTVGTTFTITIPNNHEAKS